MSQAIPQNRAALTLAEVFEALALSFDTYGSEFAENASQSYPGVSTDTRHIKPEQIFVALRGERYDAHDHLSSAVENGAKLLIVDRDVELELQHAGTLVLKVACTLKALGDLARFHRLRWGGQVIAVSGSVGKTTTRSAISACLHHEFQDELHFANGNFNNRVGLPSVLLAVPESAKLCLLEVGTNLPGEIAELIRIAVPDLSVLTNIAIEHTEGLSDLRGVAEEEAPSLTHLGESSIAIYNADDPEVRGIAFNSPAICHWQYGLSLSDESNWCVAPGSVIQGALRIVDYGIDAAANSWVELGLLGGETRRFEIPWLGKPGAYAVAAATAVLLALRNNTTLPAEDCWKDCAQEAGRLCKISLAQGIILLDDAYNANPASMLAAMDTAYRIAEQRGSRVHLCLGEMRELGALSESEHASLLTGIRPELTSQLLLLGGEMTHLYSAAKALEPAHLFCKDYLLDDVSDWPAELLRERALPEDVILIKASRGVRAERIAQSLQQRGTALSLEP